MVTTIHYCAKCGSAEIRRNGHSGGHARYQCKACGYQARFVPAAVAKAAQYAQVEALLVERNSQRSIARVMGVAWMTLAQEVVGNLVYARVGFLPLARNAVSAPERAVCAGAERVVAGAAARLVVLGGGRFGRRAGYLRRE